MCYGLASSPSSVSSTTWLVIDDDPSWRPEALVVAPRKLGHEVNGRAPRPAGGAAARGGVQSVATALELLDCLAAERELGVAELGRRLGIAKSTAHRMLTTLAAKGYVQQVP